ncbi:hypothetical protein ACU61A_39115 [Pseudonocardia sichuanensis]
MKQLEKPAPGRIDNLSDIATRVAAPQSATPAESRALAVRYKIESLAQGMVARARTAAVRRTVFRAER